MNDAQKVKEMEAVIENLCQQIESQKDRIAELEKENKALHELVKQRIARNVELQNLLSTPQTKPLSDEEIYKICEMFEESIWDVSAIDFARAIEERIRGKQ